MTPLWRLKGSLLRLLCPLLFAHVGRGAMFSGRVRLPLGRGAVRIGAGSIVGDAAFFQAGPGAVVEIGPGVTLNSGTHVVAAEGIRIGAGTAIGEYVSIRDAEHRFAPRTGVRGRGFDAKPVEIGPRCWIGRGAYLGPGTVIGAGSIVAANAVVRGRFGPNLLIAGAPATARRRIADDGTRRPLQPIAAE